MNVFDLPLTTSDIAGVGGRLKVQPEDFEVEEIPSYEPCGEGVHVYLWLEKSGVPMDVALRRVSRFFGGRSSDVGHAGIKDTRAVTRQWVSVLDESGALDTSAQPDVDLGPGLRVLRWARHGNRLRTGHLRGNRFRITVRDTDGPDAASRARQTLDRLAAEGLPNFYGGQRFGRDGGTLELGLAILAGSATGSMRKAARDRFRKRLAISAVQSHLFNDYVCRRLARGHARIVLEGDLMCHRPHGAIFEAVDIAAEQARVDAGDIVVTGPMFGHKMSLAVGEAGLLEEEVLCAAGLTPESFSAAGKLGRGTRRPILVFPTDIDAGDVEGGIEVSFSLASGSYATVLLREIMGVEEELT